MVDVLIEGGYKFLNSKLKEIPTAKDSEMVFVYPPEEVDLE